MAEEGKEGTSDAACQPIFATTHWSVVLAAATLESPNAAAALERLCRVYWYPIYAFVRHRGERPEDAQDVTQDFFAHLLRRGFPCGVTPERGRFRSFLLASLQHFLVDRHRCAEATKRGGGQAVISLDVRFAEERFGAELQHELSPDRLYERAWAATLLNHARERLRDEYVTAGKAELYKRLNAFPLMGKSDQPFEEASAELGITAGALKSAVHRMRSRYRELVREEVAHTVADPCELKEEARHLITVMSQ